MRGALRAVASLVACVAAGGAIGASGACGDDGGERADADTSVAPDDTASATDTAVGDDATTSDVDDDTAIVPDTIVETDATPDVATDVQPSTEPIPDNTYPCDHPQYWPYALTSETRPVTVHYRIPGELETARDVIGYLEHSYDVEVDTLGFRAPLPDAVRCGDDANMDVWLWRDTPEVFTNTIGTNPATSWDDAPVYMVLDTRGETAGEYLDATVSHEFNHACQAAYDWSDAGIVYEMTSQFMEDQVYDDDDNYLFLIYDFQQNPDWSIDRDDGYETWYMYGATIYLTYLRDRFFRGDASFTADMWEGLKSSEDENEPDYEDSIDDLLAEFGSSFLDSVVEFQRWRWYVAERDDGRHLEEAGAFFDDSLPAVAKKVDADDESTIALSPMMLGSMFVDVTSTTADDAIEVRLDRTGGASEDDVQWIVQALPGNAVGEDGEIVDFSRGAARVDMVDGARTLVITALPGPDTSADPDDRTDERFDVTLKIVPLTGN